MFPTTPKGRGSRALTGHWYEVVPVVCAQDESVGALRLMNWWNLFNLAGASSVWVSLHTTRFHPRQQSLHKLRDKRRHPIIIFWLCSKSLPPSWQTLEEFRKGKQMLFSRLNRDMEITRKDLCEGQFTVINLGILLAISFVWIFLFLCQLIHVLSCTAYSQRCRKGMNVHKAKSLLKLSANEKHYQ